MGEETRLKQSEIVELNLFAQFGLPEVEKRVHWPL